jgi:hypothetical protein
MSPVKERVLTNASITETSWCHKVAVGFGLKSISKVVVYVVGKEVVLHIPEVLLRLERISMETGRRD